MPYRTMAARLKIVATILLAVVLLLAITAPALAFPDVPAGHAYETAINDLASLGIIGGYTNGNFGLNDPVKRAQFAKMIVGALGITPSTSTSTRFTDLGSPDANGYPHKYVQAAYDNGITYGTNSEQTLFAPWNSIRRDQVVSMIVRGANSLSPGTLQDPPAGTQSLFTNVPEPHGQNLRIAEYDGLLDGLMGLGSGWSVTATATRGEVAQMLWNLLDLLGGTPPASSEIWVYADGSGDYPTLEAAIDAVLAANADTSIHLGPGTFTLAKTITYFDQLLTLIGGGWSGSDATTIKYAGTVVDVNSSWFYAKDIRFQCTATSGNADVILTRGLSEIGLESCEVTGGALNSRTASSVGNGLCLRGTTTGTVSHCFFSFNDSDGITAFDQVEVSLEYNQCNVNGDAGIGMYSDSKSVIDNNICRDNSFCGITFGGEGTSSASGNTCKGNGYYGIAAGGEADVTLDGNDCSENTYTGVYFLTDATGEVRGNTCDKNGFYGIDVSGHADVLIENNEVDENVNSGIVFWENATGEVRMNACSNNGREGIELNDNADVVVEDNECGGNLKSGICLFGDSIGELRGNLCNDNGMDGIAAWDNAQATVENNQCLRNALNGIRFANHATGTINNNQCSFSKAFDGIAILNQSSALLIGNVCMNNEAAGIAFYDSSSGAAGGNECAGNKYGIFVEGSANPTIETNNLHDNTVNPQLYELPV